VEFTEAVLEIRGPLASSNTSWEFFKSIETPNLYVLSYVPGYIIDPKKAFLRAQPALFRELINI
jgi:hypothetical protein